MSSEQRDDSVFTLVDTLRRKAPEYLDLMAAETDADFEKAFGAILERAVADLERNKKNFHSLDEVGISAALGMSLSIPGLSVTQEAHSNGHVDLTITADHCVPARRKLGEAKIWDGPGYHVQGLKQLLERYTTGREGRGLVISYVRKKNIKGLLEKLREVMNLERPCNQCAATADHILKWSFISTHSHSCGESLEVAHIGCNLHLEPEQAEEI